MLKDITIGQYYPSNSLVHKLDPRLKLLALIAFIVVIFLAGNFLSLGYLVLLTLCLIALTKVPFSMYFKNLKSILPIIVLTAILNMLYVPEGTVLVKWWIITITNEGISRALFMALRIVILIISSAMLTYTTTPTALTDALESLLSPLKYIGLGSAVHTIAMIMTIALRFIPTLVDETDKLMNAQKARGADFESGGIIKRIKALIPILIPLLISSVRRAGELAEAMESRCYSGNGVRTRMKQLRFAKVDIASSIVILLVFSAVIFLNFVR